MDNAQARFVQEHVYFFVIHLNRFLVRVDDFKNYQEYETKARHHGKACGKALLQGYSAAFATKLPDGKISPEFIQLINQHAMSHLPSAKPGCYREDSAWVPIHSLDAVPNASFDGVVELINKWMQKSQPIHLLDFVPKQSSFPKCLLISYCQSIKLLRMPGKILDVIDVRKQLHTFLSDAKNYECYLNFTPQGEIVKNFAYPSKKVKDIVDEELKKICDRYNANLDRPVTSAQKIGNIIIACQEILQLYPFRDGNARTSYILMNRLLHENGLPFTLLIDCNRLMAFSIDELVQFVITGQKRYLALCYRQQLLVMDDHPFTGTKKLPEEAVFIPDAKAETAGFVEIVQKNLHKYSQFAKNFIIPHYKAAAIYSEVFKHSKKLDIRKFNIHFLQKYIHFFLMDLNKLLMKRDGFSHYLDYENRENGYGKYLLKAYQLAFTTKLPKGELTPQFIQQIHNQAIGHLSSFSPGEHRKKLHYAFFDVKIQSNSLEGQSPNASIDGIEEFIEKWFIQESKPTHVLHFKPEDLDSTKPSWSLMPYGHYVRLTLGTTFLKQLELKDVRKDLLPLLKHPNYNCFLASYGRLVDNSDDLSGFNDCNDAIDTILEKLQLICDRYNLAIQQAVSLTQKIIVIITACQEIEQLHPFRDGNARTCRVLMDRLLHELKLPLVLHMDINRLDLFSIDELVHFVIAGQERYLKLCYQQQLFIEDDPLTPAGKLPDEAVSIPDAKDEVEAFVNIIQENLRQYKEAKLKLNRSTYDCKLFHARKPERISKRITPTQEKVQNILKSLPKPEPELNFSSNFLKG